MTEMDVPYIMATVVSVVAAYCDIKTRKIPNRLTMPSLTAGLLFNLMLGGWAGLKNSLLGLLVGVCCMLFWILGMLKAGDIKLYMAAGAIAGWRFTVYLVVSSIIIGGVVSAVILIRNKNIRLVCRNIKHYILYLIHTKSFQTYTPATADSYFSFGSCIAAGAVLSMCLLL